MANIEENSHFTIEHFITFQNYREEGYDCDIKRRGYRPYCEKLYV